MERPLCRVSYRCPSTVLTTYSTYGSKLSANDGSGSKSRVSRSKSTRPTLIQSAHSRSNRPIYRLALGLSERSGLLNWRAWTWHRSRYQHRRCHQHRDRNHCYLLLHMVSWHRSATHANGDSRTRRLEHSVMLSTVGRNS